MTKKEREKLKNEIGIRNVMTKKVGKLCKISFFIFAVAFLFAFWGFSGMNDKYLQVSDQIRDIIKWIAVVVASLTGVLSILSYISFRNSKKYILSLIDALEKR